MKRLFLLLLVSVCMAQTKIDLTTQVKGALPVANGGLQTNIVPTKDGQMPVWDNTAKGYLPADPIVSFNYVNLLNTQNIVQQRVGLPMRISTFGASGTLYVTFASVSGSGSGCTLQLVNYDSLGNSLNSGNPISITPSNGTTTTNVTSTIVAAAQISATYSCSSYPVGGTISVDFAPTTPVNGVFTPPLGSNATQVQGTTANAATTVGNPVWICGTNSGKCTAIATDASGDAVVVGAGTAGTPAGGVVTVQGVASGQAVAVSGTVTANAGTGTFTVSGTVTANQGGAPWTQRIQDGVGSTLATVTAGNALKVDNSAVTQPVSGTVTTTPPANASANIAQFGGNAVATGTGAGGVGIPRVTVSSDSTVTANAGTGTFNIQANASTNLNQVAGSAIATAAAGIPKVGVTDSAGTALTSTASALDVNIKSSGVTQPVSGTVTANQGGAPWTVSGPTAVGNTPTANAVQVGAVDSSGIMQNISVDGSTPRNLNISIAASAVSGAGSVKVQGRSAQGASFANPFPIAGSNAGNIDTILSDGAGRLQVSTTQSTSPWVENISQFGGNNVVTGTGIGGLGVPRVTVSSDSVILLSPHQSVNQDQVNGWPVAVAKPGVQVVALADSSGNGIASTNNAANVYVTGSGTLTSKPATFPQQAASWTSVTASSTALTLTGIDGFSSVVCTVDTAATTSGTITFEVKNSGINWYSQQGVNSANGQVNTTASLGSFTHTAYTFNTAAFSNFRARLTSVITGTGIANVGCQASSASIPVVNLAGVAVGQGTIGSPAASVSIGGARSSDSSFQPASLDGSGYLNVDIVPGVDSLVSSSQNFATWDNTTTQNTTFALTTTTPISGFTSIALTSIVSGNLGTGSVVVEESWNAGANWFAVQGGVNIGTGQFVSNPVNLASLGTGNFLWNVTGHATSARLRLVNTITDSGNVVFSQTFGGADNPPVYANVTSFGNNAVQTGTGAGGAGVPRVTVSSDTAHVVFVPNPGLPLQPCNAVRTMNCQHF